MTTDITELAQRMKAAAEKATPGPWYVHDKPCEDGNYGIDTSDKEFLAEAVVWWGFARQSIWREEDAKYIALANPANILALVEALEKAKGMEAYWKTQCRGITDHCEELQARIAELESRTVKLSPELYTIGDLIRTQDNRITDQPMFVVFQKREIIGSDEHSPSRICWVWDGEEVSELRAKRLEALYQDGRDTRGYDRYAMQEVDEFVTACFTEHGCKDYLRQNGHNLRLPYIYACGSFRNNEYQLVRNWLAGIKVEAE
ncbi:TPA: ead/Ea22-like family protein [Klebsiella pneumoniae]|uniref:ead/Ea22-like family protein n=1 Tax=Klebsiella pneumoniae TaxID=573 RepID=UPI001CDAF6AE|nr:ead/Ea22-like family protein [Klebsiella pneumoniae]